MELYYFRRLDPDKRQAYRQIDEAVGRRLPSVLPDTPLSPEETRTVLRCVTLDHPEYYWCGGSFRLKEEGAGRRLFFSDPALPEDGGAAEQAILSGIRAACETVPGSGAEATPGLHEWFLQNVRYDESPDAVKDWTNQTVYSVFVRKTSLCMGIAKAFALLLRLKGAEGAVALGRLFGEDGSRHAWNLVRVNGVYRNVDVTMSLSPFQEAWTRLHGSAEPCLLLSDVAVCATHRLTGPCPDTF